MKKMRLIVGVAMLCIGALPKPTLGQTFDAAGSRAAGMGGAFVGVADDATAIYWNPAGLATGSFFSLVLDGGTGEAVPEASRRGHKQSSYFLGLTTPALGLGYYRLRSAIAAPDPLLVPIDGPDSSRNLTGAPYVRVDTLVTHHAGVTLVQSLLPNVAVGSTLKLVRGIASSELFVTEDAGEALDLEDAAPRGETRFDADLGVMATFTDLKAGLTLRNLREPAFTTPDGRELKLQRQARAGVSYLFLPNWVAAADLDLLAYDDAFGERRDLALGLEGRLARRATVRTGVRWNTADAAADVDAGSARAWTFGASYAVKAAVFVDAMAIVGSDRAGKGWGVAARFVY
jgi:hypothetical protein